MSEPQAPQSDERPQSQAPAFLANGSISLTMAIAALEALYTHARYLHLEHILEWSTVAWVSPDNRVVLIANGDGQPRHLENVARSRTREHGAHSRSIETANQQVRGFIGMASIDEFDRHPAISQLLDDLVELTLDPTLAGAELVVLRSGAKTS